MALGKLARDLELAGLQKVVAEDAGAIAKLGEEYRRVAAALRELIGA